jgi:glycosyltransferase involved in cell wall biosynthesis
VTPIDALPRPRVGFDARYVTDRYHGVGRVAANLLEALVARDEVELVLYTGSDADTRFDLRALADRSPHVTLRHVPLPLLLPVEHLAWPLIARRDRLDVFHSPFVVGPALGRTPVVVTAHDLILERYPEWSPGRVQRVAYRAVAAASLRHATAVIAISQATAADLAAWYPGTRDKTTVIHNAVDARFGIVPSAGALARVRARYELPDRFLLAVGAARPHKNQAVLLEALLRPGLGDVPLVLVSARDRRHADPLAQLLRDERLRDRVRRLDHVAEEDLPALYTLADVFVFPSLVEGFGLPLLEAFSSGTAAIAATSPGLTEVSGGAALAFDPRDAGDLAARIGEAWNDQKLRSRLVAAGRERAGSFSWDAAAASVGALYRRLALGGAGTTAIKQQPGG